MKKIEKKNENRENGPKWQNGQNIFSCASSSSNKTTVSVQLNNLLLCYLFKNFPILFFILSEIRIRLKPIPQIGSTNFEYVFFYVYLLNGPVDRKVAMVCKNCIRFKWMNDKSIKGTIWQIESMRLQISDYTKRRAIPRSCRRLLRGEALM